MVWMTRASLHFASLLEATHTIQYITLFHIFFLLHASRTVLMTHVCSSLVSLLQVLENMIGCTAYSCGSNESMPMAAIVTFRGVEIQLEM